MWKYDTLVFAVFYVRIGDVSEELAVVAEGKEGQGQERDELH